MFGYMFGLRSRRGTFVNVLLGDTFTVILFVYFEIYFLQQLSTNIAWHFLSPTHIGVDHFVLFKAVFLDFFATDIAFNKRIMDMNCIFVLPKSSDFFTTYITIDAKVAVNAVYVFVNVSFSNDLVTQITSDFPFLATR